MLPPPKKNLVFVATLVCTTMILGCVAHNECTSNPCVNGATCLDDPYGYFTCECTHGYHGTHCEEPLSEDLDELCYFSISDPVTMVTSPGFPLVSNHNVVCYYIVRIHGAKHIRVTFNALNTEWLKDTIQLGSGNNASIETTSHIRMGQLGEDLPKDIIFNTSSIFMIYVTDHNIISQGFNVTITADFDDCTSSPCQNDGVCMDEFGGFDCACPPATTGTLCETDVISISSATPLLASDDVTISSSTQTLNLTFDFELTPSPHSANPHLAIQSTSTTPTWAVTAFFSRDDKGDADRLGEILVPLRKEQSDFSLDNHMTFRNVDIVNMRIPASITCSDVAYFCAVFNPNNDELPSSSSSSSTQSSTASSSSSSSSSSQSPEYVIRGDPDSSAFVGCATISCIENLPCEDTDCKDDCKGTERCNHEEGFSDDTPSDEAGQADQVGLNGSSSWYLSHNNIILLVVIGIVCTALIIIVILVLVKGRDKIKLMFIHTPASAVTAPVIRWIPPPTNSNLPQTTGERGAGVQGTSESYFGIVNEAASCQVETDPAPPYSEMVPDKK
ncbi:protein MTL1 [Strongylocentrotus purpuratus]|uniref:Uncharacterized protein n=1 Tax=Strongylocentrotus purpuratus TaxID=7668 RepID=A0A7M7P8G2_STRPU|nr:protein MTL1 [Strongylocentrotus purpuratus]